MDISIADLTALIGAFAALVVAVGGVIYQLRLMRADIVSAVESHKNETIAAIQRGQTDDPNAK